MASQTMLAGMKFSITGTQNSHGTQLLAFVKGTTINDLGVGPEEIEKKKFFNVHIREKISLLG